MNPMTHYDEFMASPSPAPLHWAEPCTHQECSLHQLSPYIEKLKSSIAQDLILRYSNPGELVADMFGGSGTVPLEAARLGRRVFASDASLYAVTLTQGKLQAPMTSETALAELEDLLQCVPRRQLVGSPWVTTPDSPSANRLATLINRLKTSERKRAAEKQRFVHVLTEPIQGYFGPEVMLKACQALRQHLSFLENHCIYYFIDDYPHPKITADLHENLNRLLMHRSPDIFFKLSTESPVSFARQDVDGKRFVESREYDLLNLGLRYLTDGSNQALEFLKELFNRRYREVEGYRYPVQTLPELLGSMPRNENATAHAFHAFRQHQDQEPNYAGCETVAAMCSGDIHYMIRLVSRMVEDYGGRDRLAASDATPRIPLRQQHASIRAAAGVFMESVRTLPRWGPRLADVVTAFGNVAHSYLIYETARNETSQPPHQASRIEPYDARRLSDDAQEILNELLRYSVLIEDPRGMSRRGKIVPRYYLRRYLIPHFRLTFSRRDSLELENGQIEMLLCKPQQFEDAMRLKSEEDTARRRGRDPNQTELF